MPSSSVVSTTARMSGSACAASIRSRVAGIGHVADLPDTGPLQHGEHRRLPVSVPSSAPLRPAAFMPPGARARQTGAAAACAGGRRAVIHRERCPGETSWTTQRPTPASSPTRTPKSARKSRKLCARFPGEYWRKLDQERAYPDRVRPRADRGRLSRRADPRGIRRRRPAAVGGRGDPGDDPRRGLQRRRLPRADVHHGHHPAARLGGAEARRTCRRSPPASCACRRSASPSRPAAPTPPRCAPSPGARATTTSSTARRSGPAAPSTPT